MPLIRCDPVQRLNNFLFRLCLIVVSSAAGDSVFANPQDDVAFTSEQTDFFETEIRPLLVKHCLNCHGADLSKVRGGLKLTSRESIMQGGDSGPAVVPNNVADSLLISAINYEDFEMPPSGRLSKTEVEKFAKWIEMGVPDPRSSRSENRPSTIDLSEGRKFWAFTARINPVLPKVKNNNWVKTDIDRFIMSRLEKNRLRPVADADRQTLIRRAYLTLIGLPPTIRQIDSFVNDAAPNDDAFAKVVDQLLDSRRFGERWGRHWLDVARFAESSGGGRSLMFPNAWRYRDYVIHSFNDDKPFDQMIREQIAGDLLSSTSRKQRTEQLIAAGFLVLGPNNYELQDKEMLEMEIVDEQIDTVGRAFLGLTLGCARCHDHKFDPIPASDYYALAGIFRSTRSVVDANVSKYFEQSVATDADDAAERKYKKKVKALTQELVDAQDKFLSLGGSLDSKESIARKSRASTQFTGILIDNEDAVLSGNWKKSTSAPYFVNSNYQHDENLNKGKKAARYLPKFEKGGSYEVLLSYSPGGNRASNVPVTIDHQDGKTTVLVNQSKTPPIDGLFVSIGTYRFEADNLSAVTISNERTDGHVIIDSIRFIDPEDKTNSTSDEPESTEKKIEVVTTPADPRIANAKKLIDRLNKELLQLKKNVRSKSMAMSVRDKKQPADEPIHIRGNVRMLGEIVTRGFVSVCNDSDFVPQIADNQSGRLQLAEWIADPNHPLTARVYVNRIWRHLFGRGIVESTDNFGAMGNTPTHPELLDYLANDFVANNWSTKRLIRKIMLSRVYRLSTNDNSKENIIDDQNRLYWRANRRRVDAEVIRDSILFVSGAIDLEMGGLTIRKLAAFDLGYKFDTVRRSVYVPVFRNSMLDLFEVFDFANPNLVSGHRNTSTLPTQALFMLNSPLVVKQSRFAATKLLDECEDTPLSQIEMAYRWTLGRNPSQTEMQDALKYLQNFDGNNADGISSLFHALFASLDFRYMN